MLKKYWYIFAGLIAYFFITKFKGKIGVITKPEKLV